MSALVLLAAKSLLIAGLTLLALQFLKHRSAADRSWIAHLGLAAVAVLPLALLLPQLEIATSMVAPEPAAVTIPASSLETEAAPSAAMFPDPAVTQAGPGIDWAAWAYAVPAALLLLLTLIALLRLVLLKSKATVLVEPNWLTALAKAQRRMGFKHGTALLTSDSLRSPISWGLMRPVILLNSEAADAHSEAEAIIAHELAHVARLDWAKLLLSRVTVALFWFNPLVWLLAREAHQLREEAADDSVLDNDIEDTEYARLLVGIARHECRGLLIGAHGVAPGRTSLARRVQRVLDAASQRAPGGWRWTAAAGFFAAGMAVPLATLQLVPTTPATAQVQTVGGKKSAAATAVVDPEAAAPAAAAQEVAGSVQSAAQEVAAAASELARTVPHQFADGRLIQSPSGATIDTRGGKMVMRSPDGAVVTISAPDSKGRRKAVMQAPNGSTIAYADASAVPGLAALAVAHPPTHGDKPSSSHDWERAIRLRQLGTDPDYARAMRRAAPHLQIDREELIELRALGVTPDYLRELARAGFPRLSVDDVTEARAMGITGTYARAMTSAFGRLTMDEMSELKAVGVTPADLAAIRKTRGRMPGVDEVVEIKALGLERLRTDEYRAH